MSARPSSPLVPIVRLGRGWACGLVVVPVLVLGQGMAMAADAPAQTWRHSEHTLHLPSDLMLTRQDGRRLNLVEALDDGRPVLLSFLPPRCSGGPCTAGSQLLADFRGRIGSEREGINFVSLSLEADRAEALAASQARRLPAAGSWAHFGVGRSELPQLLKAFGVPASDLPSVAGLTFLRPAPGRAWHRYEGLGSATQLVDEYMLRVHGGELCVDPNSPGAPTAAPAVLSSGRPTRP